MMENKKKIGIVTLNGYFNYGNRLQNYATEQIVKSFGYEVETILKSEKDKSEQNEEINILKRLIKIKDNSLKEMTNKLIAKYYKYKNKEYINEKKNKFKKFSKEYLNEKKYKINDSLNSDFDYFITGSDQVWNPYYSENPEFEFLNFAKKNKSVSFSASFGVSEIPETHKNIYIDWINNIEHLSVREFEGAEIIKSLTGRDSKVLLDPTMLIDRDNWINISKASEYKPDNKYLLTYIIGKRSEKWNEQINQVAKKNNLEIVNLADIKDKHRFIAGPEEYLDYFKSAEVVFTDSFHGTIFSILFNIPFAVYDRKGTKNMISRLNTLLKKFDFNDRFAENLSCDEIFDIDFSHIKDVLEEEKKKAFGFLNNALNNTL